MAYQSDRNCCACPPEGDAQALQVVAGRHLGKIAVHFLQIIASPDFIICIRWHSKHVGTLALI
jgi:hypothetical protein